MKMWKKLAACVLAAAMALTLLTACGGGGGGSTGGGSGSYSVVRDKTKEDQAISWVQEYASKNGLTLEKSDAVSNAAAAGLSDVVKALNIQMGKADGDYQATYKAAMNSMGSALTSQKKTGYTTAFAFDETDQSRNFTKEHFITAVNLYVADSAMKFFNAYNITQKTVGVAVTVQGDMIYDTAIVAD